MTYSAVTHLNFDGEARAALEFYRSIFGGEMTVATYGDFGMPKDAPGADRVVFGQIVGQSGFGVMAYDAPASAEPSRAAAPAPVTRRENGMTLTNSPFFVSVRGEGVDEVRALWDGLADGADIVEEFGPAPWAPAFGMLTDRFGVTWIIDVAAQY
ncbi:MULTISPECIES: VOC family protein [Actinomycetes]|uniref:VOC family protein n=1 Tax=Actinomycetes TaxID=1760 RepID=UPI0004C06DD6|nr:MULTISPECIES: VOC family protein [Actinomycetes]